MNSQQLKELFAEWQRAKADSHYPTISFEESDMLEEAFSALSDRLEAAERERDELRKTLQATQGGATEAIKNVMRLQEEISRLDKESQRLSDQLGACDRERRDWIKRAQAAEEESNRCNAAARYPFGYLRVVSGLSFQIMEGATRPPDRSGDSVGPWFPIWTTTPPVASAPDGLAAAVNRLLDSDGSRGTFSAIRRGDALAEVERLLATAPAPGGDCGDQG